MAGRERRRRYRVTRWAAALLCSSCALAALAANPRRIVVTEAEPDGAAFAAGIRSGDELVSWGVPGGASTCLIEPQGSFTSPFDLLSLESEWAPRGPVRLRLLRGETPMDLEVDGNLWGIEAGVGTDAPISRPEDEDVSLLRSAETHILEREARYAEEAGEPILAAWFRYDAGRAWMKGLQWKRAATSVQVALDGLPGGAPAGTRIALLRLLMDAQKEDNRLRDSRETCLRALDALGEGPDGCLTRVHLLNHMGKMAWYLGNLDEAEARHSEALEGARAIAPGSIAEARCHSGLSGVAWKRGRPDDQRKHDLAALAIVEEVAPESMEAANMYNSVGLLAFEAGDHDEAARWYRKALAILTEKGPESVAISSILVNMGLIHWWRSELDEAADCIARGVEILRKRSAGSLHLAIALNCQGVIALIRGDLATAEEHLRESLSLKRAIAPEDVETGKSLHNLASVCWERGDLESAVRLLREALAIARRNSPGSHSVANTLMNLGTLYGERGERERSRPLYEEALRIYGSLGNHHPDMANIYQCLGSDAHQDGDLERSEAYFNKALEILEHTTTEGLRAAYSYNGLGLLAREKGDLRKAGAHFERALEIRRAAAPGSIVETLSMLPLAAVREQEGRTAEAEALFTRSLNILGTLSPGSAEESQACHLYGLFLKRRGRNEEALDVLLRAVRALEEQKGKLGGSDETSSRFMAKYAAIYFEPIRLLLDLGRKEEAFHLLERSRARGLLALLAERDLVFDADLPLELERERRIVGRRLEEVLDTLGELSPETQAREVEEALRSLQVLRTRRNEIAGKIREAAPRLASLQYPDPLDCERVRSILDPGTALLSYLVGEEETILFALGGSHPGLDVHRLPHGRKALGLRIRRFRHEIGAGGDPRGTLTQISKLLLGPASDRLQGVARVAILPDGPLHFLPFAALQSPRESASFRYWIEDQPIHLVASATVYAEILGDRKGGEIHGLTAFGDPAYEGRGTSPPVRLRDGHTLTPLPYTRQEVLSIGRRFPETASVWLGAEATEERAKGLTGRLGVVHFACHGFTDESSPLDSCLALAIPVREDPSAENGLLHAWEIFENMRLDADLVVLSACETGLGEELAGEGVLGLTRAFQYAGARSIVASLWPVSDASTASLMDRFYGALETMPKDEALRIAQLDLIRKGGEAARPFHWAAFQLIGDWK